MLNTSYEVLVVGGGPAGATAAYQLARQGIAAAILDKQPFPHTKACGGGLTYRLVRRFPELEDQLAPYVLKPIDTIHFYAPDFSSIRYTYDEPLVLMIRRHDFDAMLIERCKQAGVKVVTPARVVDVNIAEKHVDMCTSSGETFRAKAVIGADGVNSVVARSVGLRKKWQRHQLMSSVVAECPIEPQTFKAAETITILFGFRGLGYGWLFPKGELLNVGIAGMLSENKNTRMMTIFEEFIQTLKTREILPSAFEPGDIRGGLIPIKGIMPKTQTNRVLLCGDAAGFVNAVTGEGIYYAMVSGELAAKSIAAALRTGDMSERTLRSYQMAWQQELGEEIAETVRIQERLLTKPRLTNIVVRTVSKHEGMKRTFTDYFMGKCSYRDLKRSLMLHFLPQYLKLQTAKLFQSLPFLKKKDLFSR
jgi:geranylgeranyl reductase family protein